MIYLFLFSIAFFCLLFFLLILFECYTRKILARCKEVSNKVDLLLPPPFSNIRKSTKLFNRTRQVLYKGNCVLGSKVFNTEEDIPPQCRAYLIYKVLDEKVEVNGVFSASCVV